MDPDIPPALTTALHALARGGPDAARRYIAYFDGRQCAQASGLLRDLDLLLKARWKEQGAPEGFNDE